MLQCLPVCKVKAYWNLPEATLSASGALLSTRPHPQVKYSKSWMEQGHLPSLSLRRRKRQSQTVTDRWSRKFRMYELPPSRHLVTSRDMPDLLTLGFYQSLVGRRPETTTKHPDRPRTVPTGKTSGAKISRNLPFTF